MGVVLGACEQKWNIRGFRLPSLAVVYVQIHFSFVRSICTHGLLVGPHAHMLSW